MTDKSLNILNYLKKNGDTTAKQISIDLNMEKRNVDALFSAAIMNAGLGERDMTTTPSTLRLTDEGKAYTQDDEE